MYKLSVLLEMYTYIKFIERKTVYISTLHTVTSSAGLVFFIIKCNLCVPDTDDDICMSVGWVRKVGVAGDMNDMKSDTVECDLERNKIDKGHCE